MEFWQVLLLCFVLVDLMIVLLLIRWAKNNYDAAKVEVPKSTSLKYIPPIQLIGDSDDVWKP